MFGTILLLILKIIGIVILVVLALIVVLLLCLLFAPVHYQVSGTKAETVELKIHVSYLLRILQLRFMKNENDAKMEVLLFGFDLKKKKKKWHMPFRKSKGATKKQKDVHEEIEKANLQDTQQVDYVEHDKISQEENAKENRRDDAKEPDDFADEKKNRFFTIRQRFVMIKNKVCNIPEKVQGLFESGSDVKNKVLSWKQFAMKDNSKAFFKVFWQEVKYIMKKCIPKKLHGTVSYGTGNPCSTAQIYGAYCATAIFPWMRRIRVIPYMEKKVLEGDIYVKGYLQGYVLAIAAKKIFLSKEWKIFYSDYKTRQ